MIVVTRVFLRVVCIVTEEIVIHTDSVISTSDIIVSTIALSCMYRPISGSAHMPTHMPTPRCKNQRSLTIIIYPHPQTYFQLCCCSLDEPSAQHDHSFSMWNFTYHFTTNSLETAGNTTYTTCMLELLVVYGSYTCMDEELVSTTDDINLHVCDPPNVFFKD